MKAYSATPRFTGGNKQFRYERPSGVNNVMVFAVTLVSREKIINQLCNGKEQSVRELCENHVIQQNLARDLIRMEHMKSFGFNVFGNSIIDIDATLADDRYVQGNWNGKVKNALSFLSRKGRLPTSRAEQRALLQVDSRSPACTQFSWMIWDYMWMQTGAWLDKVFPESFFGTVIYYATHDILVRGGLVLLAWSSTIKRRLSTWEERLKPFFSFSWIFEDQLEENPLWIATAHVAPTEMMGVYGKQMCKQMETYTIKGDQRKFLVLRRHA